MQDLLNTSPYPTLIIFFLIYDRFGIELTSNNGTLYHWSFTLGFSYFDED